MESHHGLEDPCVCGANISRVQSACMLCEHVCGCAIASEHKPDWLVRRTWGLGARYWGGRKPGQDTGETMESRGTAERTPHMCLCLCMKQQERRQSKSQLLGGRCLRRATGVICILYMYHYRSHLASGNLFHVPEGLFFS